MKARFLTLPAMVAGALFATTAAGEPLIDKHDFINPQKASDERATIELEKFFWMCDYSASTGTLDAHEIGVCAAVTEQLRLAKFDGDFDKWLAWWRLNKETQHQALVGAGAIGDCAQGEKQ